MSTQDGDIRSTILKRDTKGVVRNGAEWLALWSDPNALKSRDERRADQAEHQHRTMVARQLSAAARSVSGDTALQVEIGDRPGAAGGLRVDFDELTDENLPALRGRLDTSALFLRFHDPALHAANAPDQEGDRRFADLLETVRCEALGARLFAGIEDNIAAYHHDRLARTDLLGAHLASLVPLTEALRMVVRDTLLGRTEPSIATSAFWMWDRWLRDRVGAELGAMVGTETDQSHYADAARKLMDAVFRALEGRGGCRHPPGAVRAIRAGPATGMARMTVPAAIVSTAPRVPNWRRATSSLARTCPICRSKCCRPARSSTACPMAPIRRRTTAWSKARAWASRPPCASNGSELDRKRAAYRRDFAHLVAQLQRRLMSKQTRNWTFDLEEGLIDASRLDRVVVNPGFADAYKQEEESLFRDTAVTLLIDNSGSMRGKPIEIACIVADMVAAALEQCSVSVEVLGFTTSGWRGGKSAQAWAKAGKPPNPGRLNDLLHIVYKDADEPLRRSRANLTAMLGSDLLKENIDGEALLWAARRLSMRGESRRVLIVISDGAPVDQATLEANEDAQILDRHLREVIANIERGGQIELAAIGIKHDVDTYYRRAVRIEKAEDLGVRLIEMLDQLVVS